MIDVVIPRRPNVLKLVPKIHDLMPVVPEQIEPWLAGQAGTEVLKPAPEAMLQMWPVSKRVNSSRAPSDDPTLIEAIQ